MESASSPGGDRTQTYQHVFLMRHGDRIDDVEPFWVSKAVRPWDPPLIKDGLVRAFRTGHKLRSQLAASPFHRVFVSPFLRCIQTASEAIVALSAIDLDPTALSSKDVASVDKNKLKVSVEFGLCEVLNRLFIGSELAPKDGNFGFDISELQKMLPAGMLDHNVESIYKELPKWEETLEAGVSRYVDAVKGLADKYPSENLLLVTHGNGVGSLYSTSYKDAVVYGVEYCGYVGLRRAISKRDNSFSAGEFEVIACNGISFLPPGYDDAAPIVSQTLV